MSVNKKLRPPTSKLVTLSGSTSCSSRSSSHAFHASPSRAETTHTFPLPTTLTLHSNISIIILIIVAALLFISVSAVTPSSAVTYVVVEPGMDLSGSTLPLQEYYIMIENITTHPENVSTGSKATFKLSKIDCTELEFQIIGFPLDSIMDDDLENGGNGTVKPFAGIFTKSSVGQRNDSTSIITVKGKLPRNSTLSISEISFKASSYIDSYDTVVNGFQVTDLVLSSNSHVTITGCNAVQNSMATFIAFTPEGRSGKSMFTSTNESTFTISDNTLISQSVTQFTSFLTIYAFTTALHHPLELSFDSMLTVTRNTFSWSRSSGNTSISVVVDFIAFHTRDTFALRIGSSSTVFFYNNTVSMASKLPLDVLSLSFMTSINGPILDVNSNGSFIVGYNKMTSNIGSVKTAWHYGVNFTMRSTLSGAVGVIINGVGSTWSITSNTFIQTSSNFAKSNTASSITLAFVPVVVSEGGSWLVEGNNFRSTSLQVLIAGAPQDTSIRSQHAHLLFSSADLNVTGDDSTFKFHRNDVFASVTGPWIQQAIFMYQGFFPIGVYNSGSILIDENTIYLLASSTTEVIGPNIYLATVVGMLTSSNSSWMAGSGGTFNVSRNVWGLSGLSRALSQGRKFAFVQCFWLSTRGGSNWTSDGSNTRIDLSNNTIILSIDTIEGGPQMAGMSLTSTLSTANHGTLAVSNNNVTGSIEANGRKLGGVVIVFMWLTTESGRLECSGGGRFIISDNILQFYSGPATPIVSTMELSTGFLRGGGEDDSSSIPWEFRDIESTLSLTRNTFNFTAEGSLGLLSMTSGFLVFEIDWIGGSLIVTGGATVVLSYNIMNHNVDRYYNDAMDTMVTYYPRLLHMPQQSTIDINNDGRLIVLGNVMMISGKDIVAMQIIFINIGLLSIRSGLLSVIENTLHVSLNVTDNTVTNVVLANVGGGVQIIILNDTSTLSISGNIMHVLGVTSTFISPTGIIIAFDHGSNVDQGSIIDISHNTLQYNTTSSTLGSVRFVYLTAATRSLLVDRASSISITNNTFSIEVELEMESLDLTSYFLFMDSASSMFFTRSSTMIVSNNTMLVNAPNAQVGALAVYFISVTLLIDVVTTSTFNTSHNHVISSSTGSIPSHSTIFVQFLNRVYVSAGGVLDVGDNTILHRHMGGGGTLLIASSTMFWVSTTVLRDENSQLIVSRNNFTFSSDNENDVARGVYVSVSIHTGGGLISIHGNQMHFKAGCGNLFYVCVGVFISTYTSDLISDDYSLLLLENNVYIESTVVGPISSHSVTLLQVLVYSYPSNFQVLDNVLTHQAFSTKQSLGFTTCKGTTTVCSRTLGSNSGVTGLIQISATQVSNVRRYYPVVVKRNVMRSLGYGFTSPSPDESNERDKVHGVGVYVQDVAVTPVTADIAIILEDNTLEVTSSVVGPLLVHNHSYLLSARLATIYVNLTVGQCRNILQGYDDDVCALDVSGSGGALLRPSSPQCYYPQDQTAGREQEFFNNTCRSSTSSISNTLQISYSNHTSTPSPSATIFTPSTSINTPTASNNHTFSSSPLTHTPSHTDNRCQGIPNPLKSCELFTHSTIHTNNSGTVPATTSTASNAVSSSCWQARVPYSQWGGGNAILMGFILLDPLASQARLSTTNTPQLTYTRVGSHNAEIEYGFAGVVVGEVSTRAEVSLRYVGNARLVGLSTPIRIPLLQVLSCEANVTDAVRLDSSPNEILATISVVLEAAPEIPGNVKEVVDVGVGITVVSSVVLGVPSGLVQSGIANTLSGMLRCAVFDAEAEVDMISNPASWPLGSAELQYQRGSLVFVGIAMCVWTSICCGVVCILRIGSGTWGEAVDTARFPSLMLVVVMLGTEMALPSASSVLFYGGSSGVDYVLSLVVAGPLVAYLVLYAYRSSYGIGVGVEEYGKRTTLPTTTASSDDDDGDLLIEMNSDDDDDNVSDLGGRRRAADPRALLRMRVPLWRRALVYMLEPSHGPIVRVGEHATDPTFLAVKERWLRRNYYFVADKRWPAYGALEAVVGALVDLLEGVPLTTQSRIACIARPAAMCVLLVGLLIAIVWKKPHAVRIQQWSGVTITGMLVVANVLVIANVSMASTQLETVAGWMIGATTLVIVILGFVDLCTTVLMLVPMLRRAMGLEARSLGQALRRMRVVVSHAVLTSTNLPATADDCEGPDTHDRLSNVSEVSDVPTISYSPPTVPVAPSSSPSPPPISDMLTKETKRQHQPQHSTTPKTAAARRSEPAINNNKSTLTGMVRGLGDAAAYEIELRAEEEKRRAAMSKADREMLENREFMEAVWNDI